MQIEFRKLKPSQKSCTYNPWFLIIKICALRLEGCVSCLSARIWKNEARARTSRLRTPSETRDRGPIVVKFQIEVPYFRRTLTWKDRSLLTIRQVIQ